MSHHGTPSQPATPLLVRAGRADTGAGAQLLAAFVEEIEALYEPGFVHRSPSATPGDFGPPGGAFLLVFADGRAVACGGVKRLAAEVAEIKRMYVAPQARGRGVARALLGALEAAALDLGYRRVRLDTGAAQPQARALFLSAGYREIADYNGNPYAAFWGEKELEA